MIDLFILWRWMKKERDGETRLARQRGISIGRIEGAKARDKVWISWYERKTQAEQNGVEFDEPPPHLMPRKRAKIVRR